MFDLEELSVLADLTEGLVIFVQLCLNGLQEQLLTVGTAPAGAVGDTLVADLADLAYAVSVDLGTSLT